MKKIIIFTLAIAFVFTANYFIRAEVLDEFPVEMTWADLEEPLLGATITTINATDKISDSRSVINTNFANLNNSLVWNGFVGYVTPSTSLGFIMNSSSTVVGNFSVDGHSTTTGTVDAATFCFSGANCFTSIVSSESDPIWLADAIYTDHRFTTLNASTTQLSQATSTSFGISGLGGGGGDLKIAADGSIYEGTDSTGTAVQNWSFSPDASFIIPSTTKGIFIRSSSTIEANLNIQGSATTTDSFYVNSQRVYGETDRVIVLATSTLGYIGAGTSTVPIDYNSKAKTITKIYCITNDNTATLGVGDGTNFDYIECTNSGVELSTLASGTYTAREKMEVRVGKQTMTQWINIVITENQN